MQHLVWWLELATNYREGAKFNKSEKSCRAVSESIEIAGDGHPHARHLHIRPLFACGSKPFGGEYGFTVEINVSTRHK